MTEKSNPDKPAVRQIDALAKWTQEAGVAPTTLAEIRLDQSERLYVPFAVAVEEAAVHYLEYPSIKSYVQCNGTGCLLCRVGRKTEKRDLWPVYDIVAQTVGVLAVTENMRPHALRPALIPVMQRLASGERLLLAITKLDSYSYKVQALQLPENAEDGADKIAPFLRDYDAGSISLVSVYREMPNATIATLPEIATILKAKGITL